MHNHIWLWDWTVIFSLKYRALLLLFYVNGLCSLWSVDFFWTFDNVWFRFLYTYWLEAVWVVLKKKVWEEGSPFCSLQFGFSLVSGAVQRRRKRNILVNIVFNIEQLPFKLLLFIYSYMCVLAWLASEREFMGFIPFPQGHLSASEKHHALWQHWQPVFHRGSALEPDG